MDSRDLTRGRLLIEVRHVSPAHVTLVAFDQGGNAGDWTIDRETWEAMRGQPRDGLRFMLDLRTLQRLPDVDSNVSIFDLTTDDERTT